MSRLGGWTITYNDVMIWNNDVMIWKLFYVLLAFCEGEYTSHRWIPLTKGQ